MSFKLADLFVEITGRGVTDLSNELGTIPGLLASIGGSAGLAFGTLTDYITSAVGEAMEAQDALVRVEAQIAATGGAAGRTSEQMSELASQMQLTTRFSDETVMGAEAVIASFTNIRGDMFDRATRGAADLAAATGQDLSGAAKQLGKALNDPVRGLTLLGRAGIKFSEAQKDQVKQMLKMGDVVGAQDLVLGKLEDRYSGMAEAMGGTAQGWLIRMGNQFGEIAETVGGFFLPAIEQVGPIVMELAQDINNSIKEFDEWGDVIGDIAQNGLTDFVNFIGQLSADIVNFVTDNYSVWQGWGESIGEIVGATVQVVAEMFAILKETVSGAFAGDAVGGIQQWVSDGLAALSLFARNAADFMEVWALGAAEEFSQWYDTLKLNINKGMVLWDVFAAGVKQAMQNTWDWVATSVDNVIATIKASFASFFVWWAEHLSGNGDAAADKAAGDAYEAVYKANGGGKSGPSAEEGARRIEEAQRAALEAGKATLGPERSDTTNAIAAAREQKEREMADREAKYQEDKAQKTADAMAEAQADATEKAIRAMGTDSLADKLKAIADKASDKMRPTPDVDDLAPKEKKKHKDKPEYSGIEDFAKKIQLAVAPKKSDKDIELTKVATEKTATNTERMATMLAKLDPMQTAVFGP